MRVSHPITSKRIVLYGGNRTQTISCPHQSTQTYSNNNHKTNSHSSINNKQYPQTKKHTNSLPVSSNNQSVNSSQNLLSDSVNSTILCNMSESKEQASKILNINDKSHVSAKLLYSSWYVNGFKISVLLDSGSEYTVINKDTFSLCCPNTITETFPYRIIGAEGTVTILCSVPVHFRIGDYHALVHVLVAEKLPEQCVLGANILRTHPILKEKIDDLMKAFHNPEHTETVKLRRVIFPDPIFLPVSEPLPLLPCFPLKAEGTTKLLDKNFNSVVVKNFNDCYDINKSFNSCCNSNANNNKITRFHTLVRITH